MELKNIFTKHPNVLNNMSIFKGILLDTYNQPENRGKINLLLNAYETQIIDEIAQNDLDDVFVERLKKKMILTYSVTDNSAEWAVKTWCFEYGNGILGKPIAFSAVDVKFEEHEKSNKIQKTITASPLLKRVYLFLEDGDFKQADEYCERILDSDPECAEAYLCKLMAELKVCRKENLKNCDFPFDDKNNYKKALRFADDTLSQKLQNCIESINNRNLSNAYNDAVQAMQSATTENGYKAAANKFNAISSFRDAKQLAAECVKKAESIRINNIQKTYDDAIKLINSIKTIADLDKVVEMLSTIEFHLDSRQIINDLSEQKSKYKDCIFELVKLLKESDETEAKKEQFSNEISSLTNKLNKLLEKQKNLPDKLKRLEEIKRLINEKNNKKNALQNELSSLGIFSGKRKKELAEEIQEISRSIDSLKKDKNLLEIQIGSDDSVYKINCSIKDVQLRLSVSQNNLDQLIANSTTDNLLMRLEDNVARRLVKEHYKKITLNDGAVYEGELENGTPIGYGVAKYKNGKSYKGGWRHGLYNGLGCLKCSNGNVYEGMFFDGKKRGEFKITTPNGFCATGRYDDDRPDGCWDLCDQYGNLKETQHASFIKGKNLELERILF